MVNKTFKIGVISLFVAMFGALFLVVPTVNAATSAQDAVCETLGSTDQSECDPDSGGGSRINGAISVAINMLSIAAGVASVIMLILGGFKYITSSGDSNSLTSAKNTILYAIIGLVIVATSQVIVKFVLNTTDGTTNPTTPVQQAPQPGGGKGSNTPI